MTMSSRLRLRKVPTTMEWSKLRLCKDLAVVHGGGGYSFDYWLRVSLDDELAVAVMDNRFFRWLYGSRGWRWRSGGTMSFLVFVLI